MRAQLISMRLKIQAGDITQPEVGLEMNIYILSRFKGVYVADAPSSWEEK